MKVKIISLIVFYIIFFPKIFFAQKNLEKIIDFKLKEGIYNYEHGQYIISRKIFSELYEEYFSEKQPANVNTRKATISYYLTMSSLKLLHDDSEYLVKRFLSEFPSHPYASKIMLEMGNVFVINKDYKKALSYYNNLNEINLNKNELIECYFYKGYSYLMLDSIEEAKLYFYKIKDKKSKYQAPAIYYYSHINYTKGNYETALDGFKQLIDDETFGEIAPYYIAHIYFLQKKYDELIKYVPDLLEKITEKRKPEVLRMLAEAYFNKGNYSEAINYLEQYKSYDFGLTKEDKYQLAYSYYMLKDYEKAAELFSDLGTENSLLGQNAMFHLADCYIKLNKKHDARMAFYRASNLNFDPFIQEESAYYYAVITYELSYAPFNEAINALLGYIEKYPNSQRLQSVYEYLIQAYLNTNNYRMAYESMKKIKKLTPELYPAWQKISYYRGIELFKNQEYDEAIKMFDEAQKFGILNEKIYSLANYWKAESKFKQKNYKEAIRFYNDFVKQAASYHLKEYPYAFYGIGYCYYNLKNYNEAINFFRKFLTSLVSDIDNKKLADAYNRLGDCYLNVKNYNNAIEYYDRSIKSGAYETDYAFFQKALTLGLVEKPYEKIDHLKRLISRYPTSGYIVDAYYELATTLFEIKNYDEALNYFTIITEKYRFTNYYPKSLVSIGLIYYNMDQYEKAIVYLKRVIEDFPESEETKAALNILRNVYVELNNPDEYYAYVKNKNIKSYKISETEQDSITYIVAENLYMQGKCKEAIEKFNLYLNKFPQGNFRVNANFYLGDCYYKNKEFDRALENFDKVISLPFSPFKEQALLMAGRITYQQKQYKNAINYFNKLLEISANRQILQESQITLMRCYYNLEDYSNSSRIADEVLKNYQLDANLTRETRYIKAKSLYKLDRLNEALEEFKNIATEVISKEGAESKYLVAEIYYKQGNLKKADEEIFDFTQKTTPHAYWMGKAFLLWADILYQQGDVFQAIQTLQSLIDYYEIKDDGIIDAAKQKKQYYQEQQDLKSKPRNIQDVEIKIK